MTRNHKDRRQEDALIRENIRAHDRVHRQYEGSHGEIYNPVEQERPHRTLAQAKAYVSTSSPIKSALDFGCGPGNLPRHSLELRFRVTAADVSRKFLDLFAERYGPKVTRVELNGCDLCQMDENSFDFVGAYSVLHHIPDYLSAVRELVRLTRPGGIVYIDHEVLEIYVKSDAAYSEFRQLAMPRAPRTWRRFLEPSRYLARLRNLPSKARLWINPRYMLEGDIHIWPDDHIEWDEIEQVLVTEGCTVMMKEDYLLVRPWYLPEVYDRYSNWLSDMRVLEVRKGGLC